MRGRRGRRDWDAFDEFCAREYPRLVGSIALIVGDADLAADSVCEALARAWKRHRRGGDIDSIAAYVRVVALNVARDHFRHAAVENKHLATMLPTLRTNLEHETWGLSVDVRKVLAESPASSTRGRCVALSLRPDGRCGRGRARHRAGLGQVIVAESPRAKLNVALARTHRRRCSMTPPEFSSEDVELHRRAECADARGTRRADGTHSFSCDSAAPAVGVADDRCSCCWCRRRRDRLQRAAVGRGAGRVHVEGATTRCRIDAAAARRRPRRSW